MLSLITSPWLPARDKSGRYRRIRPVDILDEDIVDLAWPRADFQCAGRQWLIGVLQKTVAPVNRRGWERVWENGLDTELFTSQLASLEPAFRFGAEKPSFMQDMASLDGENLPIAGLLIDAPGAITLKLNKDHFIKRGTVQCMCPACAAMAAFTLQTNAPSGGQGHRTSLRGGGPVTSLVWPLDEDKPLWRRLWLNVLTQEILPASPQAVDAACFPWCGPTRTSEKDSGVTTPDTVHKQQVYWGMPRRIEIDFSNLSQGECDLCGEYSEQLLTHYRTKNYGVQYSGWDHPLTPYRKDINNPDAPKLSVKGQPGGLLYKDWAGLIFQGHDEQNDEFPAAVVQQVTEFRPDKVNIGLNCFAYDMDNMKARCWYQHQLPLVYIDDELREEFQSWLRQAVQAAREGVSELKKAVKKAWFKKPADVRGDVSFIELAFWQETEPDFINLLVSLQAGFGESPKDLNALAVWRNMLFRDLLKRFDDLVFSDSGLSHDPGQQINARKSLYESLRKSSAMRNLVPEKSKKSKKSKEKD